MSDVRPQIFTSTYDQANRLASVVGAAGYGYDRNGLRMGAVRFVGPESSTGATGRRERDSKPEACRGWLPTRRPELEEA